MASKSILIVASDAFLVQTLKEQLDLRGEFLCHHCSDAASARTFLKDHPVDLLLLDKAIADMDGLQFCRELRAHDVHVPVILLTSGESDPSLEDDAGADDVISKPFRLVVLLTRIRHLLRNHEQNEESVLRLGPYDFKPAAKLLLDGAGSVIRLTEKETNILKFLLARVSETVGRDVLLAEVWGYNSGVTTHTLETHIYRLRQKIERDPSNASILMTEAGGYRLVP